MQKVMSETEALLLCKENRMKIEFKTDSTSQKHYVVVTSGFKEVAGNTFVESVNRMVDLYHTAPANHEELDWYQESQRYLYGKR